jgi:hypothetical protein
MATDAIWGVPTPGKAEFPGSQLRKNLNLIDASHGSKYPEAADAPGQGGPGAQVRKNRTLVARDAGWSASH